MADPRFKRKTVNANFRWDPQIKAAALEVKEARGGNVSLTDVVEAAVAAFAGRPDLVPASMRGRQEVIGFKDTA